MAKPTSKAVTWYAHGYMHFECSFPNGKLSCNCCDFCRSENSGQRCRCMQTGEILYAPTLDIGRKCPLKIHYPDGHEPETNKYYEEDEQP